MSLRGISILWIGCLLTALFVFAKTAVVNYKYLNISGLDWIFSSAGRDYYSTGPATRLSGRQFNYFGINHVYVDHSGLNIFTYEQTTGIGWLIRSLFFFFNCYDWGKSCGLNHLQHYFLDS